MNLSEYFRKKRMERGLTQLDVSFKLGLTSDQFVSRLETGKASFPLNTIGMLFVIYEISIEDQNKIINYLSDQSKASILTEILKGNEDAIKRN